MVNQSENYSCYYYYNDTEPRTHCYNLLETAYVASTLSVATLGLFFNVCAITIITKGKRFGKSIKTQLINLTVADMLCSVVSIVSKVFTGLKGLSAVQFWIALEFLVSFVFLASLLSNTAISLERFVAVYFPLKMREYRRKHVTIVVVTIWTLSAVTNALWFLKGEGTPEFKCYYYQYDAPPTGIRLVLYGVIVCCPVIIMITCYTLICIKLKRRKVIGERRWRKQSRVNIQVRED